MHVPKSNKQPLSDEKRCRRIWIPIPGRPTWLGGNWDTSIGQFNCADRTRRTLCCRRKPWKDQRSIAAGFTMTTKPAQKILTIPLHARTWWVRLSQANTHTPRDGLHNFTIAFSHQFKTSWSLLLTDARNWQKSSTFARGSQMRQKLANDAYLCFTNPSYIRPKYAGSRLSPIHKQKN